MVKIRLLDDQNALVENEAFLTLEKHGHGFAVTLLDLDGDKIGQPFVLFLEPDSEGKLVLSLAQSPSPDFVQRNEVTNTIVVNLSS